MVGAGGTRYQKGPVRGSVGAWPKAWVARPGWLRVLKARWREVDDVEGSVGVKGVVEADMGEEYAAEEYGAVGKVGVGDQSISSTGAKRVRGVEGGRKGSGVLGCWRWRPSICWRLAVRVWAAWVWAWPMGRKLVWRLGMEGERSRVGEGGVGEVGDREISSRRSAMDLVSSRRLLGAEGDGSCVSWRGWFGDVPKRGAMLIRMERGPRVNSYGE